MSLITDTELADQLDLPVALPAAVFKKDSWIVLATVKLQNPMRLTYRFLQLQLQSVTIDPAIGGAEPTIVDATKGLAYVAIFKNYGGERPGSSVAQGTNFDVVNATAAGLFERATSTSLVIDATSVATYSFVLVNNTGNADLKMSVCGQVRLDLNSA